MDLASADLLILAIGAVLAMLAYLLVDVGRPQEAAVSTQVDRELTTVVFDPTTPERHPDARDGEFLSWAVAQVGSYTYRPIPPPTPAATGLPRWLRRALAHAETCHALDPEDQLVAFLRVTTALRFLHCPLIWSCRSLPGRRGIELGLSFTGGGVQHDAALVFAFDVADDLRHAICLTQQELLRIDFLVLGKRLRHGGSRLVPIPGGVAHHMRRALLDFDAQENAA